MAKMMVQQNIQRRMMQQQQGGGSQEQHLAAAKARLDAYMKQQQDGAAVTPSPPNPFLHGDGAAGTVSDSVIRAPGERHQPKGQAHVRDQLDVHLLSRPVDLRARQGQARPLRHGAQRLRVAAGPVLP